MCTHLNIKQQRAMEKSTRLGHRKGSGIADNPMCVGEGTLVGGVQSIEAYTKLMRMSINDPYRLKR